MRKNLLLTGEKQIGKTTAIKRFLELLREENEALTVSGFRTVAAYDVLKGKRTIHMLAEGRQEMPAQENMLFVCGERTKDKDAITKRFDSFATSVLQEQLAGHTTFCADHIILMDELGPHESQAKTFCQTVYDGLYNDALIIGVMQEAQSDFLSGIKEMKIDEMRTVEVVRVTEENRDIVPMRMLDWYHGVVAEQQSKELPDSYGAIVFSKDRSHVLMIKGKKSWSFPKGHGNRGESGQETAIRETLEETGVKVIIPSDFSMTIPSAFGKTPRNVTFYLGEVADCEATEEWKKPLLGIEVLDAAWVPVEEAAGKIRFDSDRDVYLEMYQRVINA